MTVQTASPSPFYDPAMILEAIAKHSGAKGTGRAILLALASYVRWSGDNAGICFPSMETLAKDAKCCVRTAQRHIKELVETLGEVTIIKRGTGRKTTVYRLTILDRVKMSPLGRHKSHPNKTKDNNYPPTPQKQPKPKASGGDYQNRPTRFRANKSGYGFKGRCGGAGSPQSGGYGGRSISLEKAQEALTAHPWRAMSRNDVTRALSAMPSQLSKAFMEEAKAKGEGSFMAEYFAAWKWSGGAKA